MQESPHFYSLYNKCKVECDNQTSLDLSAQNAYSGLPEEQARAEASSGANAIPGVVQGAESKRS